MTTPDWFYLRNGKDKAGPVTFAQLQALAKAGQLRPTDMVWKEGMAQWAPANNFKALFTNAPPAPPPVPPMPAAPVASKGGWQGLSTWAKIGIIGGAVLLLIVCAGIANKGDRQQDGRQQDGKPAGSSKAMEVSALTLFQEYKANQVAADEKYKGKLLEISGTVKSVEKHPVFGTMFVALEVGQFEFMTINCYFDDKNKGEVSQLAKGQSVTIRGRCTGKTLVDITVEKCVLVK